MHLQEERLVRGWRCGSLSVIAHAPWFECKRGLKAPSPPPMRPSTPSAKNYCDCKRAGVPCGEACRCLKCSNCSDDHGVATGGASGPFKLPPPSNRILAKAFGNPESAEATAEAVDDPSTSNADLEGAGDQPASKRRRQASSRVRTLNWA